MVHPTYNLFLALYLAYLLAVFVFQTDFTVVAKNDTRWTSALFHAAVLLIASIVIVAVVNPSLIKSWRFDLVAVALSLVHAIWGRIKSALAKIGWIHSDFGNFAANQTVHFGITILAACVVVPPSWRSITTVLEIIRLAQSKILLLAVVYMGVIFGGGHVIRFLISPLWKEKVGEDAETHDEVVNAGLYIGWLERFLALTAICLQSPSTVGLILTAKSIARYSELKADARFVEYFLIGTLLSISMALIGGALLLKVFYGTVSLGR